MKKILSLVMALFILLSLSICVFAAPEDVLLYDEAGLLSGAEFDDINGKLQNISNLYNAQINIVTIPSAEGVSVDALVEDIYDGMGMGYGAGHDGVLLLVCMDPRQYRILSNGFAADAISLSDIEDMGDIIASDLSDGDYADAFDIFIDQCEYYLDGHINGFPFRFGFNLLVCFGVAFVAALISVLVMKGQLKSVRKQDQAHVYVTPGSMKLTLRSDLYLYRNVVRTKRETSSSSGRSGSSRNVGGGSF